MDNALWERFTEDMTLRNFAPKTRVAYMSRAKRFAEYYGRSPREMGQAEVRAYLLHLIDCKLSPSTLSVGLGALRFLYAVTLGRPEEIAKIPVPKRPRLLPEILLARHLQTTIYLFIYLRSCLTAPVAQVLYSPDELARKHRE